MKLEVSKRYFFHCFNQMWFKFYDIAYHGEIQAFTFPGNGPSFTKYMAL